MANRYLKRYVRGGRILQILLCQLLESKYLMVSLLLDLPSNMSLKRERSRNIGWMVTYFLHCKHFSIYVVPKRLIQGSLPNFNEVLAKHNYCITASGSRNHQLLAAMKKRRKSPNLPQDEGAPPLFLGALSE